MITWSCASSATACSACCSFSRASSPCRGPIPSGGCRPYLRRPHFVRSRAIRRSAFARPDWTGKPPRAVLIRTLANQRRTASRGSTYGIERDHYERGTRRYQPEATLSEFSGYRDHKGKPHPPTEGGITSSYLEQKRCDVELGYEARL